MKWIGNRISFVDDKLKTTIVIYPEKKALVNALMGAWVAMWLTIGATVLWAFIALEFTDQELIALFVFMAFWLYYAIRVTRSFFWLLWGKELLMIDEASFHLKKSIKGYGKSTAYFLENITKIRVYHPKERSLQSAWEQSPWVKGGERMEFDYMGKLVRFGRKINEKDAALLFKLIAKKMNDRLKKMK